MKILVMTAIAENEVDLEIVIVARPGGVASVSPIITLAGEAHRRRGNPYGIYGDAVAKFTGCDKFNTSISVFHCASGDFEGWL